VPLLTLAQVCALFWTFASALARLAADLPAALLAGWSQAHWTVSAPITRAVVVAMVASVAATAVWKDFHAITGTRRLFLASLAVGTLMVVLGA
jgi:PTS system mannose-specific IIC component